MTRWVISKPALLALVGLFGVAALVYAAQTFNRKAESSISIAMGGKGGVDQWTIMDSKFHLLNVSTEKPMLLQERLEVTRRRGIEGELGKLEVTAWGAGKEPFDKKLWVIQDQGVFGGTAWGTFYISSNYGCCGAMDIHRAYDLKNGKYAFSYTEDPIRAQVYAESLNTKDTAHLTRYISFISVWAGEGYDYEKEFPQGVGELTLYDYEEGTVSDHLIVLYESEQGTGWEPLSLSKIVFVNPNAEKGENYVGVTCVFKGPRSKEAIKGCVKGFSVTLDFDGWKVVLPVEGDRFDLKNASVSHGLTLKRIPVRPAPAQGAGGTRGG
ncbi:MAG: hypothetical protein OEV94_04720 [Deltaproteobacteria bacterium]|nr:hypothetical protein [Deltaproteobacteria bacterium]